MSLFDTGVRPIIDQWLLEKSKEVRSYGEYWSASSAGYCMRKVIFDRLGVPAVTEDARKQRVFSSGHIFHEWMQRITKEAGISIAQEPELQDESLMIRGHIDDLVLVADGTYNVYEHAKEQMSAPYSGRKPDPEAGTNKHLILYDYKTVNSQSFKYKKEKMSHYWKLQLGTYMYMLRNGGDVPQVDDISKVQLELKELTEARILLISKDDLRLAEQQLLWTPELEKEVVEYWTTLNKLWKDRKLPPCSCDKHEGGFMAAAKWNPYYFNDEPCSLAWLTKCKEEGRLIG